MHDGPLSAATAEAVWALLAAEVRPGRIERLSPAAALGRVLARDALSRFDYPPFDRAIMDGYAVRCGDFVKRPQLLRLVGAVRAGEAGGPPLPAGCCQRINTGAPLPPGADGVVIVEQSRGRPDGIIELADSPAAGQHIERRAALRRAGERLAAAGTVIRAGELAALISGGADVVDVYAAPTVTVCATGDELTPSGVAPGAGQIPDSNGPSISSLVEASGGRVIACGRSPDDPEALAAVLADGLSADVLIVTGGMSKGTHDLAPEVLERLGVAWRVTSLDLKPGKPTRIGRSARGGWVLGLPGNPVSCAVCFLLFGGPLLAGLAGLPVRPPPRVAARLDARMSANGARPLFQPGVLTVDAGGSLRVRPGDWRGSGDPFGLCGANALVARAPRAAAAAVNDEVLVIPIGPLA